MLGDDCSCEQRGVARIEYESFISHGVAGGCRFGKTLFGERNVVPTGEQIEAIPFALAVAENDKGSSHRPHRTA